MGVGSLRDDPEVQGLAHFTEHMIFLGSKSYPHPSTFEDHLSDNLGSTNAFTDEEQTTFFFDVNSQGYDKALVMFSRMFAEPLFDMNFMNKEINAVNSENEKNLNSDDWREAQVLKALADQNSEFSRYTTGNNQTLRYVDLQSLHQKLLDFYNVYYRPEKMKLVVLCN